MASRVLPGVICTNCWLMPGEQFQHVPGLRAPRDPTVPLPWQWARSLHGAQWGAPSAGAGTDPSLTRMLSCIRDRRKAIPRLPPCHHAVHHLWGQRWPPLFLLLICLEPDDWTSGEVSPAGLGSFSFGAEARTNGPRQRQTDDYCGQGEKMVKSPHIQLPQLVKALPSG